MKSIIIALMFFTSCKAQEFVKISPEQGTMDFMLESGELFKSGSVQTYFIGLIQEYDTVKLKHGFIVIKLSRTKEDRKNIAYRMLDSLNEIERSHGMDTGKYSNWSREDKDEMIKLISMEYPFKYRFFNHVKIYVEKSALASGISEKCYLKYE